MMERTLRKKTFSDGKRFLGRPGERWRAAEATVFFQGLILQTLIPLILNSFLLCNKS
jgi:hypothetical protein